MASFRIEWKQSALKELKSLDRQAIPKIVNAIEGLQENPLPKGSKKLVGSEHADPHQDRRLSRHLQLDGRSVGHRSHPGTPPQASIRAVTCLIAGWCSIFAATTVGRQRLNSRTARTAFPQRITSQNAIPRASRP